MFKQYKPKLALILGIAISFFCACDASNNQSSKKEISKPLHDLFDQYWEQKMKLLPLESTAIGDTNYNDMMPVTISESYRDTLKQFYKRILRTELSERIYFFVPSIPHM